MAIRVLTNNSIENTNIDGARLNYFNAGRKDGIIGGAFNEGLFYAASSNTIALDTCELLISGHRVVINETYSQTMSSVPVSDIEYSLIAEVVVNDSSNVSFRLFIQNANVSLIKDNLFANETGAGTYQIEIGKFTYTTSGTITNVQRIVKVI